MAKYFGLKELVLTMFGFGGGFLVAEIIDSIRLRNYNIPSFNRIVADDSNILENITIVNKSEIRVHDGDTLWVGNKKIRTPSYDAAEVGNDIWSDQHGEGQFTGHNCGGAARDRAKELINNATSIGLLPEGKEGENGRDLEHVVLIYDEPNGKRYELLGIKLIQEGHAYQTITWFGKEKYKPIGELFGYTAAITPKPHFQDPHIWKKQFKNNNKTYSPENK